MGYKLIVIEIRKTWQFEKFLNELGDRIALTKITTRIERLQLGNEGDVAAVGEGISEMRIHHGPGYRVYFKRHGAAFILLLCAGDKKSQSRDIAMAKQLAKELEL